MIETSWLCTIATLGSLLLLGCQDRPPRVEPETNLPAPPSEGQDPEPESTEPEPESTEPESTEPEPEPEPEPLTQAQRAEVARALARGRKAAKAKDWARALEQFLAGIAIDPRDARLQCEAGFAAYNLEDPRALELLKAGVAGSRDDPRLRASCLHNLGRWHERAGERDAAADYYADSLTLRPDNEVTRGRYRKLTGQDPSLVALDCPPPGRFADVEAFCQAMRARKPDEYDGCGTDKLGAPVSGPALGDLVRVVLDSDDIYWSDYLLVRRGDALEVLGRVGSGVDRSCSTGSVKIDRLTWLDGDRLVVDLHRRGRYDCNPTPYEDCVYEAEEKGKPASVCDGVSDEWKPEITNDHPRMLCRLVADQLRCSTPPEYYSEALDPASTVAEVPEGAAFDQLLVCPPKLRTGG